MFETLAYFRTKWDTWKMEKHLAFHICNLDNCWLTLGIGANSPRRLLRQEGLHLAHIWLCDASCVSEPCQHQAVTSTFAGSLYTPCQKFLILHFHPVPLFQFHFRTIRHLEILSRAAWLLLLPLMPLACLDLLQEVLSELSAGVASAHAGMASFQKPEGRVVDQCNMLACSVM